MHWLRPTISQFILDVMDASLARGLRQLVLTVHAGLQQLPVLLDIAYRDWHALALRDPLHSSTGALSYGTPCNHNHALNKL